MTARRRIVAFASLLLVLSGSVSNDIRAQIPSLGETIEVSIVNVDVVVTDADGKRVRGLTTNDFEVYEDGKLQPLSHFAEYRGEEPRTGFLSPEAAATLGEKPAETSNQPSQRRTLVIFIEVFKLPSLRVDPFIAAIKDLVRNTIRSGDSVSLVSFDGSAKLRISATDDVAAVERVLDEVGRECVGPVRDRIGRITRQAAEERSFNDAVAARAASIGMRTNTTPTVEEVAVHTARIHAIEARVDMNRRVATINTLISGMAGIEGKKILLMATHRLGEYIGAEYYFGAGLEGMMIPPSERSEVDNRAAVRSIIANANASDVTIFPMFPTGLDYTPSDPSVPDVSRAVLMNEMMMLNDIAEKTGGVTSYGTGNAAKLMTRLAEDMSTYYSIAYRASARRDDSARKIMVRMKDRKLTARARQEFVEKSDDTQMRDRVLAALHDAPSDAAIQLQADLGPKRKAGRKTETAPLKVRIPINALTLLPQGGRHSGAFTVYAITGGMLGEVSDVTRRTQTFDIPARDLDRALAGHFTYDLDVIVNERTRKIAIGVIDEVSKTYGLVTVPFEPAVVR